MSQKEKAEKLVRMYYKFGLNKEGQSLSWAESKQLALMQVDSDCDIKINIYNNEMYEFCPDIASQAAIYVEKEREEVKREIEKL
jgi:hypothetical protein